MANIEKLKEDIEKTKKIIKAIEQVGGKMPKLKSALNRFETAINTGEDIIAAAKETSQYLKEYTSDLLKTCGEDERCIYMVRSRYQANAVNVVFSTNINESVVNNSIRNTLRRYMPELICKRLDACK